MFEILRRMLEEAGVAGDPAREAAWILESVTGARRAGAAVGPVQIAPEAAERALELARKRASGEPLQYVTGVAGFRRLELRVGPGVFIPRPETELVAGRAMELLPRSGTAVDVCTGSGAIALAIAHERPDAVVLATESSPGALSWARTNVAALSARVELIGCDLLTGLPPALTAAVDVVVSNPPYVARGDAARLATDVREHEPPEALFAGAGGLEVIERVALEALPWLAGGGWVVIEIGETIDDAAASLLARAGYERVSVRPDLAGRPRIVEGRKP